MFNWFKKTKRETIKEKFNVEKCVFEIYANSGDGTDTYKITVQGEARLNPWYDFDLLHSGHVDGGRVLVSTPESKLLGFIRQNNFIIVDHGVYVNTKTITSFWCISREDLFVEL